MAVRGQRRDALAEELAGLARLRQAPLGDPELAALRRALAGSRPLVAARAAEIAAERGRRDLLPELGLGFARLLELGAAGDPGCSAKLAIARALLALETESADEFAQGVNYVQQEPVRGGSIDSAGTLRGTCLTGLVAMGNRDALFTAVPLLVDANVECRRLAVEALGMLRMDESELLLRLKIAGGDDEPLVLADAFAALMTVNPERSLTFVAGYLDDQRASDPDVVRGAALAIGESRHPQALTVLQEAWERARLPAARDLLLLPIALTRCDAAFDHLLALLAVAGGDARAGDTALAVVESLRVFRADEARRGRVEAALTALEDAGLSRAFARP